MIDHRSDDSFLAELERAAKGLSVVTDQASSDELRRLFSELHDDEQKSADTQAVTGDPEFAMHSHVEVPARPV